MIDIQRVKSQTHFNRKRLQDMIARAERAWGDLDKSQRIEQQRCRWCFYGRSERIAGQAFTERKCDACDEPQTFATTATNRLCMPCAQRLGLCVECCADVDLVDRRKLERGAR